MRSGKTFYARRKVTINGEKQSILMHQQIMATPKDTIHDHIDHDGLNNQRGNLRICTKAENGCNRRGLNQNNTTGFRGVVCDRRNQKFRAAIRVEGQMVHLGFFETARKAGAAFDVAAEEYFGGFYSPIKESKVR